MQRRIKILQRPVQTYPITQDIFDKSNKHINRNIRNNINEKALKTSVKLYGLEI